MLRQVFVGPSIPAATRLFSSLWTSFFFELNLQCMDRKVLSERISNVPLGHFGSKIEKRLKICCGMNWLESDLCSQSMSDSYDYTVNILLRGIIPSLPSKQKFYDLRNEFFIIRFTKCDFPR